MSGYLALPENHRTVVQRFCAACAADSRIVAAFLGGSYATGTADAHSDLDLYAITAKDAYDEILADRRIFLRQLGEPIFSEDFNSFGFDMVIFIFADGVEGELSLASVEQFTHIHGGPVKVLVDKNNILSETIFPLMQPTHQEQREVLRQHITWFWRDLSLFTTAMSRQRLWTAQGYLENLRQRCINLMRLQADFTAWADGYEKLELAVDEKAVAQLLRAFGPLEHPSMLEMAQTLLNYYLEVIPSLTKAHDLAYPADLERVVSKRFTAMQTERDSP